MRDESAVAQPLAFLVAGVLFIGALGAILLNTQEISGPSDQTRSDLLALQGDAGSLLSILLGSPGLTASGQDWLPPKRTDTKDPDHVERLGLLNATSGYISFEKLENLRGAPLYDDPADGPANDGYANYADVRAAFGFDASGLDFHIRAKPSLPSVMELLSSHVKDQNLRVTYLADVDRIDSTAFTPGALQCTNGIDTQTIRILAPVTNDPGAIGPATQFQAAFEVKFPSITLTDTTNTGLLAYGDSFDLYMDVPAYGDCTDISSVSVRYYDPSTQVGTSAVSSFSNTVSPVAAAQWLTADPGRAHYLTTESVIVSYDGNLDAKKNTGDTSYDTVTLTVTDVTTPSAPVVVYGPTAAVVPNRNADQKFAVGTLPAGEYDLTLALDGTGITTSDHFLVTDAMVSGFGGSGAYTYTEAAQAESAFLNDLVYRYCPFVYDSVTQKVLSTDPKYAHHPDDNADMDWATRCRDSIYPPHRSAKEAAPVSQYGDVFPDQKQILNDELPKRLMRGSTPRYDLVNTLIVGSNVDHNTMTSAVAKNAVRDWVLGGGTLIVFGSADQVVQWLQPIFHSGIQPSGGELTAPDPTHPLLKVADDLDWNNFKVNNAWSLQQNGQPDSPANLFTGVVGPTTSTALTISDPGAYKNGTIMLTSWLPYDLYGDGSAAGAQQGRFLVNNLLMQGYRDLFLDYGPPLPAGAGVTPAWGNAQVQHPDLGPISLDVVLYVFHS